jgi:hypothetical protein
MRLCAEHSIYSPEKEMEIRKRTARKLAWGKKIMSLFSFVILRNKGSKGM